MSDKPKELHRWKLGPDTWVEVMVSGPLTKATLRKLVDYAYLLEPEHMEPAEALAALAVEGNSKLPTNSERTLAIEELKHNAKRGLYGHGERQAEVLWLVDKADSLRARVAELEEALEGFAGHVAALKPQYHDPLSLWLEKARAALQRGKRWA